MTGDEAAERLIRALQATRTSYHSPLGSLSPTQNRLSG
jgi:hypothetical protein